MQTFWHETMHAMLDMLSYDRLSGNEQFVDQMAGCIHQVLVTKKGNANV